MSAIIPQPIPFPDETSDIGFFCAADLHGEPVPEQRWHVRDFIPARTVTIINGDGGTGKSLLALQLAVATARGTSWLGLPVTSGRALVVSAEDDRDEIHRRLATISTAESFELRTLSRLTLRSLAGTNALLADLEPGARELRETALYGELAIFVEKERPALVVLDTLADLFGGDEINRAHACQFVGMLRRLALDYDTTIVLLAHPSLAGMSSGSGSSGSTAWNNSVRSRLYLQRVRSGIDGRDPNARTLEVMKANHGPTGLNLCLRWENGVFVTDAINEGALDRMATKAMTDRVFLKLLRERSAQGRHVSHNPGPTYAPAVFSKMEGAEGCHKKGFVAAMDRLFDEGKICVASHGNGAKARCHMALLHNSDRGGFTS